MTELTMTMQRLSVNELQRVLSPSGVSRLLVASASYEARGLSIPLGIEATISQATIFFNENRASLNASTRQSLAEVFSDRATFVGLDTSRPLSSGRTILDVVDSWVEDASIDEIVVDVTTFTHESLQVLAGAVLASPVRQKMRFVYCFASDYAIDEDNLERKWLSKGVGDVRPIFGFSGDHSAIAGHALIVLCGLEEDRTVELAGLVEPGQVFLGYGFRASSSSERASDWEQMVRSRVDAVAATLGGSTVFGFEVDSPHATRDTLVQLIDSLDGRNVSVACLSSKLATIGAAAAAVLRPRVQLLYATAELYNFRHYSSPSDVCALFEL